jgi:hypothetical protein
VQEVLGSLTADLAEPWHADDAWRAGEGRKRLYQIRQGQEIRVSDGGYVASFSDGGVIYS